MESKLLAPLQQPNTEDTTIMLFKRLRIKYSNMTTRPILLLIYLFFFFSTSENLAQGWINEFGIYGTEEGESPIVVGLADGHHVLLYNTSEHSFLSYMNASGTVLWDKAYTSYIGHNIIESHSGGFWILGTKSAPDPADSENIGYSVALTRTDETGTILFENRYDFYSPSSPNDLWEYSTGVDLIELEDGTVIILADPPGEKIHLYKVSQNGEEIWAKLLEYGEPPFVTARQSRELIATSDGNFMIVGNHSGSENQIFLLKFNLNGELLWYKLYGEQSEINPSNLAIGLSEATDGGYFIASGTDASGFTSVISQLIKTNEEGEEEWSLDLSTVIDNNCQAADMVQAPNGDLVLLGFQVPSPYRNFLLRISQEGQLVFLKAFDHFNGDLLTQVENTADNGFLLLGEVQEAAPSNLHNFLLIKTDGFGTIYSNAIQGTVVDDENENCLKDEGEYGFKNWIVRAEGPRTYYGITDSLGNYFIDVDTGSYAVQALSPIPYWESCDPINNINLSSFLDTTEIDFIFQDTVSCPLLEVDISTPLLRRCFENTYSIYYGNIGSATSENTMVVIEFDEFLDINSSTIPWLSVEGNIYTFEVADLAPGEVGSFNVNATANCDNTVLGQTHCVTAHIYPDSLCVDPDPNWDGSSLIVTGTCEEDSVRFIVRNIGLGDMDEPVPYLVVEDNVMLNNDFIQLNSQEEIEFAFPANGATYYFGALQTPGHPGQDFPNAVVEGCGGPLMSLGYVSQFPENDGDPFVSIDCQENIGSYDPNDKIGYPIGWTNDHLIEKNIDLEYRIRFQNTGTDTAFNIYILDTLSTHLDVSKLRPGVSSHPYELDIIDGNILRFTFNNIMLPDSNVNEAASNGFVKFKIAQQQDLPLGTIIYNDAAIYFDFNPPIITNETFHTIGERLLTSAETIGDQNFQGSNIQIYPNPFEEQTTIDVSQNIKLPLHFRLYDLRGQLIREEVYHNYQFTFERKGLPKGLYFYVLSHQNQIVQTSKLIIQ